MKGLLKKWQFWFFLAGLLTVGISVASLYYFSRSMTDLVIEEPDASGQSELADDSSATNNILELADTDLGQSLVEGDHSTAIADLFDLALEEIEGTVALAYLDLSAYETSSGDLADASVTAGNSNPQESASVLKLFVMQRYYELVADGELSPDDTYTIEADDLVTGAGTLDQETIGKDYTLEEIVSLMMTISDNTATNIIVDQVGGLAEFDAWLDEAGYNETLLNHKFMSEESLGSYTNNVTTVEDQMKLLADLWSQALVTPELDQEMLALLKGSTNSKLAANMPASVTAYNKTGEIEESGTDNDALLFLDENGNAHILVAMITGGDENRLAHLGQLGEAVYQIITE